MGNCCANTEELPFVPQDPSLLKSGKPQSQLGGIGGEAKTEKPKAIVVEDLDAPYPWAPRNCYQKFEQSLPFNRIHIASICKLIDQADNEGKVTLHGLSQVLNSPAWQPLQDQNSTLAKVLLSPAFKDEKKGTEADEIDTDALKCFALLHSQGENQDRAIALYSILQDGGIDNHQQITATDKDYKPTILKLCSLVTKDIFKLAHLLGEAEDLYDEASCETMFAEDNMEDLREEHLDTIFGNASRLGSEAWIEKVSDDDHQWIFTVEELRNKVMEKSGVITRH